MNVHRELSSKIVKSMCLSEDLLRAEESYGAMEKAFIFFRRWREIKLEQLA